MILNHIKISYKLILLFVIFAFVLIDIGAFGFAAVKDMARSFETIKDYSVPSLSISSQIQERVHLAIFSAYDYLMSDQEEAKNQYDEYIKETFVYQVQLFEVTKEQADVAFLSTLNQDLFDIKTLLDQAIGIYQENKNDPRIDEAILRSASLRDEINTLLRDEVEGRISNQAKEAALQIEEESGNIFRNLMIAGGVAILILIILVLFINRSISRPIKKLAAAAQQMGQGNLVEVKVKNKDELGLFAQTFNQMGKDMLKTTQALKVELEKTKKLDQQKTEFLAVAAHQLRTPSAGVKWVLDMAVKGDMGKLTKDQKYYLGRGLENISRMTKVVDDLLNVTEMEQMGMKYNFAKNDLNELIKELAEEFASKIKAKKLKFSLDLGKLNGFNFDADKIRMAVSNLLDNAVKYTQKGFIKIATSQKNGKTNFSIEDTGVGIPAEAQNQIFSKFFRAKNALQIFQDGSGLGLFVAKDIVEAHGGKIWFKSEENKGTAFYIELPLSPKVQKTKGDATSKIQEIINKYKKAPSDYLKPGEKLKG